MYSRTNHGSRGGRAAPPRAAPFKASWGRPGSWGTAPARSRAPALTSEARTARSWRLPRAAESLRDLLRKSAPGEGLPRELAENPRLTSGSTSPAPGTPGRGHNGPPALHASSPVRAPCAPAGSRHQAPGSARPPSARDIRPGRAPLRAEDGAGTRFRRAQSGLTGPGASPGPSVDSGRA